MSSKIALSNVAKLLNPIDICQALSYLICKKLFIQLPTLKHSLPLVSMQFSLFFPLRLLFAITTSLNYLLNVARKSVYYDKLRGKTPCSFIFCQDDVEISSFEDSSKTPKLIKTPP